MVEEVRLTKVARAIRERLPQVFDGCKFSVRVSRFSGGEAVSISWTDGPSEDNVRKVVADGIGFGFENGWRYLNLCRAYSPDVLAKAPKNEWGGIDWPKWQAHSKDF